MMTELDELQNIVLELKKIQKQNRWIIKHYMKQRDGAEFKLANITSETK